MNMNPPVVDTEVEKETVPSFHCDLYDVDIVHKIPQELFLGLSSARFDNTTYNLFQTPSSEIRPKMIGYLTQRNQAFLIESIVLDTADIISDFIDHFGISKRNFFIRCEGRIDDFFQDMEVNGFWPLGQWELVVQTILKNVDFKDAYHCGSSFN